MTFNLRLSRTGVVAMRQDSSYYNNWIPRNWGEKGVKIKKKLKINCLSDEAGQGRSLMLSLGGLTVAVIEEDNKPAG